MRHQLTPAKLSLTSMMRRYLLRSFQIVLVAMLWLWSMEWPSISKAAAKHRLKIMSYNIHAGVGMDKQLNLQRITDVIMKDKPGAIP